MNESKPDGEKTFLLLGGYGSAGLAIAQLVLKETNVRLILAGRDGDRARQTASSLNVEHPGNRVDGMSVDAAADLSTLELAFRRCDLVMVCAPLAGIGAQVFEAALAAGVDYVSLNLDATGSTVTKSLAARVEQAGLRFVTDAGLVPGGPAVLARSVASRFDRIDEVIAAMLVRDKNISYGSAIDAMSAIATPPVVYDRGSWNRASLSATRRIDFGPPFGTCTCYPFALPEMRLLPERLGLQRCSMYTAGTNGVSATVVALWYLLGLSKVPWLLRLGARALVGTNRFTRPPLGVVLAVEVAGESAGRPQHLQVCIRHDDGYIATAIPVLACLLQMLDGTVKKPGIHMMGHIVDAPRFMDDIGRLGMAATER
ncbi:MAG: saccharopine dehydrogenase NADP-binding domain-containing protein [Deltaproteobacteria bacterium]|nr:saccharopine dehydrogenase NADP-binding domain-containing protein [Deltaproteobacteria bacterium]